MKISSGTGNGYDAKVNSTNRLTTQSISEGEGVHAVEVGKAYNINTGLLTVSGDATLLYIKNNDDEELVIEDIALGSFEGITHSDDPYISIIRNPTGGDLISDTTAVSSNVNRNFGSNESNLADAYKGKTGGTLTGGTTLGILQVNPGTRNFYSINLIVPKGSSIGVTLTANVTSGSASWYTAAIVYLKTLETS